MSISASDHWVLYRLTYLLAYILTIVQVQLDLTGNQGFVRMSLSVDRVVG
jgi:hypothetical protein